MGLTFSLFLQNIVAPLIVRASFDEFGHKKFPLRGGRNADFGPLWYPDFGKQMTMNLVVLAIRPFLHVFWESLLNSVNKCVKKSILYTKHRNNLVDNIKYIELNAGPEYNLSTKSATTNVIVATSIIFGTAFPILYGIAFFALIFRYLVERYSLAKIYRLPPRFSGDLVSLNVNMLFYVPFISLSINFWMFGNKQMFSNSVDPKISQHDIQLSNHFISDEIEDMLALKGSTSELILFYTLTTISLIFLVIYLTKRFSALCESCPRIMYAIEYFEHDHLIN